MSPIIEALKGSTKSQLEDPSKKKTGYELTQEELASIYFAAGEKPRNPGDVPVVIKVIEKPGLAPVIPWIITSVAFLITAFSLFSTKRVFVDIKVIDEKNPYFSGSQFTPPWAARGEGQDPSKSEEKESFGEAQKIPLDNVVFDGASRLNSTFDRSSMTLVNSSISPFARATVYFETPTNLKNGKIIFYAKGRKGGENIGVALKDKGNVLAFDKGKVMPFPKRLTNEWQRAEVAVKDTLQAFDPTSVTSVRFEFGSNTQNKPGDTLFVKDIQIVPGA